MGRHALPSIFPQSKAVSSRPVLKHLPVGDVIKVLCKIWTEPICRTTVSSTDDIAGNSRDHYESLGSELLQTENKLPTNEQGTATF